MYSHGVAMVYQEVTGHLWNLITENYKSTKSYSNIKCGATGILIFQRQARHIREPSEAVKTKFLVTLYGRYEEDW